MLSRVLRSGWKPKNYHSLENLKYLHSILVKNSTVTAQNRNLLVETLRSISEILIWGDQNDSSVFDFFLEKNMLSFFKKIMKQKSGESVCVQLLQTLNILFENISHETSLYFLLSNNHVNSIIVHKFDFADEEVMAYYISFLKILSLKLNPSTLHLFYNEQQDDFPLLTEALKFFNHSESMVRTAVRTITLNCFRVEDSSMRRYVRSKVADVYFANLTHVIGQLVLEINALANETISKISNNSMDKLRDLCAEHMDHLSYIQDMLTLDLPDLSSLLMEYLLPGLVLPLYLLPLSEDNSPVSLPVALYLLSHMFQTIHYPAFTDRLSQLVCCTSDELHLVLPSLALIEDWPPTLVQPHASVAEFFNRRSSGKLRDPNKVYPRLPGHEPPSGAKEKDGNTSVAHDAAGPLDSPARPSETLLQRVQQIQSEEAAALHPVVSPQEEEIVPDTFPGSKYVSIIDRPFLGAVLKKMDCSESDHLGLLSIVLLLTMFNNPACCSRTFESLYFPTKQVKNRLQYNCNLFEYLSDIVSCAAKGVSIVRGVTIEMCCQLIKEIVTDETEGQFIIDQHLALIENIKEESCLLLRRYFKGDEMFLDLFEDEYSTSKFRQTQLSRLIQDAAIMLRPITTPMSGIGDNKRLPCGEMEHTKLALSCFFHLRNLAFDLEGCVDFQLPLASDSDLVREGDRLDLQHSDLIGCYVITKSSKDHRFLVTGKYQLVLVEPDYTTLGWGIVKFTGPLQNTEVTGSQEDNNTLNLVMTRPAVASTGSNLVKPPLFSAQLRFDDHIRAMAARHRIMKGRESARQLKMGSIAEILDLPRSVMSPGTSQSSLTSTCSSTGDVRKKRHRPRSKPVVPSDMAVQSRQESSQNRQPAQAPETEEHAVLTPVQSVNTAGEAPPISSHQTSTVEASTTPLVVPSETPTADPPPRDSDGEELAVKSETDTVPVFLSQRRLASQTCADIAGIATRTRESCTRTRSNSFSEPVDETGMCQVSWMSEENLIFSTREQFESEDRQSGDPQQSDSNHSSRTEEPAQGTSVVHCEHSVDDDSTNHDRLPLSDGDTHHSSA